MSKSQAERHARRPADRTNLTHPDYPPCIGPTARAHAPDPIRDGDAADATAVHWRTEPREAPRKERCGAHNTPPYPTRPCPKQGIYLRVAQVLPWTRRKRGLGTGRKAPPSPEPTSRPVSSTQFTLLYIPRAASRSFDSRYQREAPVSDYLGSTGCLTQATPHLRTSSFAVLQLKEIE